jgi:hypothetical protein
MKKREEKKMKNDVIERGINEYNEKRDKSEINNYGLPTRGDRI